MVIADNVAFHLSGPNKSLLSSSFFACARGYFPRDLIPLLQLLDPDRMDCRFLVNLDRDIPSIKHIVFRPETGIQSVQTTDRSFEQ